MTFPAPPACPQCRGPLAVGPGSGPVSCQVCGLGIWVEQWPNPQPPPPEYAYLTRVQVAPPAAGPAPGPAYGQAPGASRVAARSSAGGGRAVLAIVGLAVPAALSAGLWAFRGEIFSGITSRALGASGVSVGGSSLAGALGGGMGVGGTAIDAADKKHVDLTDLIRQARAVALKANPRAVLTTAVIQKTVGGLVDTTGDNTADLGFSWSYHDTTKPAGADLVQGHMTFAVYGGSFRTVTMPNAMGMEKAIPDPACTSQKAWAAGVASGVPSNAIGQMHLYDNSSFSPKSPIVWSIRVEGHDELRREIDAKDCHLVKSWAK